MGLHEDLDEGGIGFFWPVAEHEKVELGSEPLRGHLARVGQWARLETLEEDTPAAWLTDARPLYRGIIGSLPQRSVLLLEVTPDGYSRNFGGSRASVEFNAARTVIGEVPLETLKGLDVLSLSARFLGIARWAGRTSSSESIERGPDGRTSAWSMRVEGGEPERVRLKGGGRLVITPDWLTEGAWDERVVLAPTKITCEFSQPQEIWRVLQPLVLVQDLVSFLHRGFIPAHSGSAAVDIRDPDSPRPPPSMWNGLLMVPRPAVRVADSKSRPLVSLKALGGPRGLARWIRTATEHPRAVQPFVGVHRLGPLSSESAMRDAAAGIEYWVAANRRSAPWATSGAPAQIVASHLGRSFRQWSGEPTGWATRFWDVYNELKHNPNVVHDPNVLFDLALSGQLVLAAAVLNEVAGTKRPGAAIFAHHDFDRLGSRLRSALETGP